MIKFNDPDLNYSADIVRCVRSMPLPDLNPVRHVLYKGAWLRADGWQKPKEGAPWWLTPTLLGAFVALLVCRFWL